MILGAITVYPFIYAVNESFHGRVLTRPQWGIPFVGFRNYVEAFAGFNLSFLHSLSITLVFTSCSVAASLILGIAISLFLLESEMKGKRLIQSLLLIPMVMSPVVVGFFWRFMYNELIGIIPYFLRLARIPHNSILGSADSALPAVIIVDIWEWTPFTILVCLAGLAALPIEPFESAKLDGASKWQIFRYITLPLLRPTLMVALIFRTIDAFKTFDSIYIMTKGGPGVATETLTLMGYKVGFEFFQMGTASAYAILMLVIGIIFTNSYLKLLRTRS